MRFFLYEHALHSALNQGELESVLAETTFKLPNCRYKFEKDPSYDRFVAHPKFAASMAFNSFMPDVAFRVIPNPRESVLRMTFSQRKSIRALFWVVMAFLLILECALAIFYGMDFVESYYLFLPPAAAALLLILTRGGFMVSCKSILAAMKERM